MRSTMLSLLLVILLSSCAPSTPSDLPPDTGVTNPSETMNPTIEPPANPFAPKPGDVNWARGEVFIQESGLLTRESFPPQIALSLSGDLPTPCHELRAQISPPDEEKKVKVVVYSVVDPNQACIQMLESFQEQIELGTFSGGHYAVWLNGEMIGEFDS